MFKVGLEMCWRAFGEDSERACRPHRSGVYPQGVSQMVLDSYLPSSGQPGLKRITKNLQVITMYRMSELGQCQGLLS